jgi:hypothetical protein
MPSNDKMVPFSDLSMYGMSMLRDNLFHAAGLAMCRTGLFPLSRFESARFSALTRFDMSGQALSDLDARQKEFFSLTREGLYSAHEKLGTLIGLWKSFALNDSKDLCNTIYELLNQTGRSDSLLNELREFQDALIYDFPGKKTKAFGNAVNILLNQQKELKAILDEMRLSNVIKAWEIFASQEISVIDFSAKGSLSHRTDGLAILDFMVEEKKIRVAQLPASYFAENAPDPERFLIDWNFSSKVKVVETFLNISGKSEGEIQYLTEKEKVKKHDLAKDLFALIIDKDAVEKRRGEHICLYFEKDETNPAPRPGISLNLSEFWPLVLNLKIIHETGEFLMLEVVRQKNAILVSFLNTPKHNQGRLLAYVNPVM